MSGRRAAPADFRILGPLQVAVHGAPVPVRAPKQRALLVTLLLRANHEVPLEELFLRLWDEDPPVAARAAMHVHVARLRALLDDRPGAAPLPGQPQIHSVGGGYLLETPPETIDLHRFREAASRAAQARQAGDVAGELGHLKRALAEWRDGPHSLDAAPSLAREVGPLLVEDRLRLVERRLCLELAGRPAELIPELRALVAAHPLRERLWYQLILALHLNGQSAAAATAYEQARSLYRTRLGIAPSQELYALYQELGRSAPGPATPPPDRPAAGATDRWQVHTHLPATVGHPPGHGRLTREVRAALARSAGGTALPIVCLSGPPGPGRTERVVALARQLAADYPDGQWYVNLSGPGGAPRDPAELLTMLLRMSGLTDRAIPDSRQAHANAYRARLADRRVLLILDDVRNADQIRDLLPGTARCAVLAVSATPPPDLVALHSARPISITPVRSTGGRGRGPATRRAPERRMTHVSTGNG